MKLLTTLFLLVGTLISYSQCEAPIVTNWNAVNDSTFIIDFIASESSSGYVVNFVSMYENPFGNNNQVYFSSAIFSGEVTSGLNTISHDASSAYLNFSVSSSYYYKVELGTLCNSDTIWANDFYMSRNSLLNNDGFDCQNMFYPIGYIADAPMGNNELTISVLTFDVAGPNVPNQIDDFSILLDIGHTFCGDFGIELISPAGTLVTLLYQETALNQLNDFSVLFQEGSPNIETNPSELGYVQGIYSPDESFDAFIGESPLGTWTIQITDYIGGDIGYLFGVCVGFDESICVSSLSGNSYFDLNSNGVMDNNDQPFPYGFVSSDEGTSMIGNQEGEHFFCYPEGDITVQLENLPLYHNVIPENYSYNLTNGDYLSDVNFAIQPIPDMEDLAVDVFHVMPDRPGFDNVYFLNYSNLGTECIDDVIVEFSVDSLVEIVDVLGADDYAINDQILQVNVGSLCPYESGTFEISILISTETQIGDELSYSATISPSINDQNITDNNNDDLSIVVGSFDPNDKTVDFEEITPEFLADGKEIEYIIRFQNTGNYYAENVVIRDPLDDNLVPNSLLILDASHPMIASIHGNDLVFEFNEIILPSIEDDEEGSNGFVRFSLKPQPDFSFNDVIENTGYIFFDFNEPIVTNTVNTILYEEPDVSLVEYENSQLFTFPNPVNDIVYLEGEYSIFVDSYLLFDLLGNQIHKAVVLNNSIDLVDVSNGIYLVKLLDDKGELISTNRLVVSK